MKRDIVCVYVPIETRSKLMRLVEITFRIDMCPSPAVESLGLRPESVYWRLYLRLGARLSRNWGALLVATSDS